MLPVEAITVAGAAAVAVWVIWLVVAGKLHTDSEVQGLREDKKALFEANTIKDTALLEANETLKSILSLLQNETSDEEIIAMLVDILARLPERSGEQ